MPLGHEVDARARHGAAAVASAVTRLALLAAALAVLLPVHLLSRSGGAPPTRAALLYLRFARGLLGLHFNLEGAPAEPGPALLVSNHVSWADIFVLGSAFPVSFVAKAEVAGWPVLGWLVRQHGTVFVDRTRRSQVGEQRNAIAERLRRGGSVLLFPEGTSSDGRQVLPFKSALFAAVDSLGVPVQPITLDWVSVGGRPVDSANRASIAWIDDMELLPHIWGLLLAGGAQARLVSHPAIAGLNRRELARLSHARVAEALSAQAADLSSAG
jgi:1-acyl-sn-glycerol-3-phosphate acyltransferase